MRMSTRSTSTSPVSTSTVTSETAAPYVAYSFTFPWGVHAYVLARALVASETCVNAWACACIRRAQNENPRHAADRNIPATGVDVSTNNCVTFGVRHSHLVVSVPPRRRHERHVVCDRSRNRVVPALALGDVRRKPRDELLARKNGCFSRALARARSPRCRVVRHLRGACWKRGKMSP